MAIKIFEKYFMDHQYVPKIFHDPYKNPPAPPSYILNVRSLTSWYKNCDEIKIKELEKREKEKELTENLLRLVIKSSCPLQPFFFFFSEEGTSSVSLFFFCFLLLYIN